MDKAKNNNNSKEIRDSKNQVKIGAILSYILIILNSLYGFIIAPFILGTIGESEYGVYKTIGALTATISVMELGIGSMLQRFIAQFRAVNDEQKCSNMSAIGMVQATVLSVAMALVGIILYFCLDSIYSNSFTLSELTRSKQIYIVLLFTICIHIFENALFGIITGYNKFIFSNTTKIFTLIARVVLYYIILPIYDNAMTIVLISLLMEILIFLSEFLYLKFILKHKIKLYSWDKELFSDSIKYALLLFVQSLIIQFNGNIDNIVIGALIGTAAVTVYSFAIQLYNMYDQCSTAISGVVLPSITNMIYNGADEKELENIVIKYGKVQWMVLGAALGGFICLGQEFFSLWLGQGFEDCYYLSLILMIPVTFPLVVNTCLAILKAKKLMGFRTVSLALSAILNMILTIIGTRIWGYWAAAFGTAISTLIGSVIALNIYYHVKLRMNMLIVYLKIMWKISVCALFPCLLCFFLNNYLSGSWGYFLIKVLIFIILYGLLLMLLGGGKAIFKKYFFREAKK